MESAIFFVFLSLIVQVRNANVEVENFLVDLFDHWMAVKPEEDQFEANKLAEVFETALTGCKEPIRNWHELAGVCTYEYLHKRKDKIDDHIFDKIFQACSLLTDERKINNPGTDNLKAAMSFLQACVSTKRVEMENFIDLASELIHFNTVLHNWHKLVEACKVVHRQAQSTGTSDSKKMAKVCEALCVFEK